MRGLGSIPNGDNILWLDFFLFSRSKDENANIFRLVCEKLRFWLLCKDSEVPTYLIGKDKKILIGLSIQDIHIIFWIKFNCVNFLFRICAFRNYIQFIDMIKFEFHISDVFLVALRILFSTKTSALVTPADF